MKTRLLTGFFVSPTFVLIFPCDSLW